MLKKMLRREKEKGGKKKKNVREPGVEPGSTAWKAAMLTVTPLTHFLLKCLLITIFIDAPL